MPALISSSCEALEEARHQVSRWSLHGLSQLMNLREDPRTSGGTRTHPVPLIAAQSFSSGSCCGVYSSPLSANLSGTCSPHIPRVTHT